MRCSHLFVAVVGLFAASVVAQAATLYPVNNGFEVPNLMSGGGAYEYYNVPGWVISGGAGEAANGSAFNVSGATNGNSDGTTSSAGQAAFLQNGDGTIAGSSISQAVAGFSAGTAVINFSAEQRNCCGGGSSSVYVYLDGNLVDTVTAPVESFQNYSTAAIPVTSGSHTISFAGSTNTGDQTSFIDNVSITNTASAVPEPASLVLLGLGALGVVGRCRRFAR